VLGICDFRHKTPRQSQISLTPAMRDRHGPKDQVFQGKINAEELTNEYGGKKSAERCGKRTTV
jgi:hypothetical protein